jgi:hypothetical protein
MIFDLYVSTGLAYSIFGNIYKYVKDKDNIEKNVQKLPDETNILIVSDFVNTIKPPTFISTGTPGAIVPIGGGSNIEERDIYTLLDNKYTKIMNRKEASDSLYRTSYINNNDHLMNLYNKYNINSTSFPVSYPLKIYEKKTRSHIYYNERYYDSKKINVIRKTLFDSRKPFTFTILASCMVVLSLSWYEYYNYGMVYYDYPIFHPKRYSKTTTNLKKNIRKWFYE